MRILTRGDFDGLVCAVLITEAESISEVRFAHPKAVQDREVEVSSEDIVVNLPYHSDCGIWFDHHVSEQDRGSRPDSFKGKYGLAPSCARLVFEYYALPEWSDKYRDLMVAVDKIDSAMLSLNDILRPEGWVRLANTVDPRTGFIPSRGYFMQLIEWIKAYPIQDILEIEDVHRRIDEYVRQYGKFQEMVKENSRMEGKVVLTDFRSLPEAPVGSRFLVYALYPSANVSARVFYTPDRKHVTIAVGHSVINRTCGVDVGNLMAEYGGGGHVGAGSCRVFRDDADDAINDIVGRLNSGC